MRKWFQKRELLLLGGLMLVCLVAYLAVHYAPSDTKVTAIITVEGQTVRTLNLTQAENETIRLENGVVLQVKDHVIFFAESDCNDKSCVRMGKLSRPGQTAVCLPNRTVVRLISSGSGVDGAL